VRPGHGHVLDLRLTARRGVGELEVPDDPLAIGRDQHIAAVEVLVQLLRGVLGELEERPELGPVPLVQPDADGTRDAAYALPKIISTFGSDGMTLTVTSSPAANGAEG